MFSDLSLDIKCQITETWHIPIIFPLLLCCVHLISIILLQIHISEDSFKSFWLNVHVSRPLMFCWFHCSLYLFCELITIVKCSWVWFTQVVLKKFATFTLFYLYNAYLIISKLAVDDVQSGVNDANTHVCIVESVFTHAVWITVLHTHVHQITVCINTGKRQMLKH